MYLQGQHYDACFTLLYMCMRKESSIIPMRSHSSGTCTSTCLLAELLQERVLDAGAMEILSQCLDACADDDSGLQMALLCLNSLTDTGAMSFFFRWYFRQ